MIVQTSVDGDRTTVDIELNSNVDNRYASGLRARGVANRDIRDRPDAEIGEAIAFGRAMISAGKRIIRSADRDVRPLGVVHVDIVTRFGTPICRDVPAEVATILAEVSERIGATVTRS